MKHSSFDATISALDVETSTFRAATLAIARRSFDATISALDAETSAIARSYHRYWRGVNGDCVVGITPQMCNRVTNHGDMSTFSKPALLALVCYLQAALLLHAWHDGLNYHARGKCCGGMWATSATAHLALQPLIRKGVKRQIK